jgi:hypothetical protein
MPTEKFIIARNRDAGEWLERYFAPTNEKDISDDDETGDSKVKIYGLLKLLPTGG